MFKVFAILGALLVGVCLGSQPPINAGLGRIANPKLAAFVNFMVGGVILLLLNLVTGSFKDFSLLKNAPWYLFMGGVLGSVIVFGSIIIVPVIGTGSAISIFVSLQLITGMVIDHFGWFGVPKVPIDWMRIVGSLLMLAGVRLIIK